MNQNLAPSLPVDIHRIPTTKGESLHTVKSSKKLTTGSGKPKKENRSSQTDAPFAAWREDYHTGNQEIDREHQELFELVNSLHHAMLRGEEHTKLKLILEDLASHTMAHFQQEEMLMDSCNYPRYERHKQSHDGLKNKVVDLLQKFNLEKSLLTVAVTQFLTDWLVHHIKGEDRKLTEFLQEQPDQI